MVKKQNKQQTRTVPLLYNFTILYIKTTLLIRPLSLIPKYNFVYIESLF